MQRFMMSALVWFLCAMAGASASGTHIVRGQVYACKTIEKSDALTDQVRQMRGISAYLDIKAAANAGECQLFLAGDAVFLQSRRSAQHVCVRPVGKPDCFWLAESRLRPVPNPRPAARR
jgi:hypothetical protein